jgi:hypothetical protein
MRSDDSAGICALPCRSSDHLSRVKPAAGYEFGLAQPLVGPAIASLRPEAEGDPSPDAPIFLRVIPQRFPALMACSLPLGECGQRRFAGGQGSQFHLLNTPYPGGKRWQGQ